MNEATVRSFKKADAVRTFAKGKLELIEMGGRIVGRATYEPGWKWSESLKAIAKTKSCQAPHFQYHVSGVFRVKMEDGTTFDCKAGDLLQMEAGHDAWVVGDEPVVVVDFQGMTEYAKGLLVK